MRASQHASGDGRLLLRPGRSSGAAVTGRLLRLLQRAAPGLLLLPVAAVLAALSLALVLGAARADGRDAHFAIDLLALLAWVGAAAVIAGPAVATAVRSDAGTAAAAFALTAQLPARCLLIVTACVVIADRDADQRALVWAAGFVLLVATLFEPFVARVQPPAAALNLPGFAPTSSATTDALAPFLQAVTLLWGLCAVVDVPEALGVVLALLAGAGAGLATAMAVRARRRRPAQTRRMTAALAAHAPAFAVYTGRSDGGVQQVLMWLPQLERLGRPYVLVTRREGAMRALARAVSAPVVARDSWRQLDDVVVPSLRAAFYVNSVASNSNFVGYRQLTHVYLGHGESDKPLSYHPSHAMYDQVFVAGQAAIERYARHGVRMRPDAFVIVGRPQLEAITAVSAARRAPPTVLYAPTWAGYNADSSHSSLGRGTAVVRALLAAGAVVVFRPHPFSRQQRGERALTGAVDALLRADAARTGRAHAWGPAVDRGSFADSANASDAMVADLSSVITDFLGSGKPIAVIMTDTDAVEFVTQHPVAAGAYLVRPDLSDLPEALASMLGDDPLRPERERTRDYYLGGMSGPEAVMAFTAAASALL